jgi:hypothetical protein
MAALCALAVLGCPGTTTLQTEYVEGVVTLDGEPLEGATVTFVPVSAGQGMSATGLTDAQGKYTLTAVGGGEVEATAGAGTLPGEYHVGVVKLEMESPPDDEITEEEAKARGVEDEPSEKLAEPKITHIVPQKYNDPRKSGLKATVQEGDNSIPIELASQ